MLQFGGFITIICSQIYSVLKFILVSLKQNIELLNDDNRSQRSLLLQEWHFKGCSLKNFQIEKKIWLH